MRDDLGGFLLAVGCSLLLLSLGLRWPLWEAGWVMLLGGVLEFLKKESQ